MFGLRGGLLLVAATFSKLFIEPELNFEKLVNELIGQMDQKVDPKNADDYPSIQSAHVVAKVVIIL